MIHLDCQHLKMKTSSHNSGVLVSLKISKGQQLWAIFLSFLFLWNWILNSRLRACKASGLPLESVHFTLIIFGDKGLTNHLPRLALHCDPPNCSLPSS
jgi:hypothetical protein